jgi:hypothetical protein
MDRVDWTNGIIYEIKPDNPAAEAAAQAQFYAAEMDRLHPLGPGRQWQWRVVTYNMAAARQYLEVIGYLPRPVAPLPRAGGAWWVTVTPTHADSPPGACSGCAAHCDAAAGRWCDGRARLDGSRRHDAASGDRAGRGARRERARAVG